MTNTTKSCLIQVAADAFGNCGGNALYMTVAYDKGKPAVRLGRKAVSLFKMITSGEIVWLPKAIGKSQGFKLSTARQWSSTSGRLHLALHPAAFEVMAGIIRAFTFPSLIPLLPSFPSILNHPPTKN